MSGFFPLARSADSSNDPSRTTSAAKFGTASVVLKAKQGRLYRLEVVNVSATPYYLMVFDSSTLVANTAAPIWRRRLPASGELVLDLDRRGLGCLNGIVIALSSTDATLTLAIADDAHFAAQWK